jgi:hypothetical protein
MCILVCVSNLFLFFVESTPECGHTTLPLSIH